MTMKTEQNSEVYEDIVGSGKSLLQLYIQVLDENKKLKEVVAAAISAHNKI